MQLSNVLSRDRFASYLAEGKTIIGVRQRKGKLRRETIVCNSFSWLMDHFFFIFTKRWQQNVEITRNVKKKKKPRREKM